MKILKLTLLIIFLIIALLFAVQNFETTRISFYRWSAEMPLSVAIIGIYILGALSGSLLFSILKKLMYWREINEINERE